MIYLVSCDKIKLLSGEGFGNFLVGGEFGEVSAYFFVLFEQFLVVFLVQAEI